MKTLKIGKTEFQVTSKEEMVLGVMEKTYRLESLSGKRVLKTIRLCKGSKMMFLSAEKGPRCLFYLIDADGTLQLV